MNSEEFNKIGLYRHNIESYQKIKDAFAKGEKVVGIVHATGTGKSYNALQLAYDNKDKKIVYVVPSIGIIEHINKIIQDNPKLNMQSDFPNLEFRTYQSFINMSEEELKNLDIDLLIIDEFHHLGAPVWGSRITKIVETHKDMQIFGMTAYTVRDRGTAYERDMANLETDELFSNKIVSRYDLCDAMIDELLPQPIYKTAYINLLELEQELEEKIKTINLSAEQYQEYMRLLDSAKKRIAEAPSIPELIRKNIKRNGKYIYFCPPGSEAGTNDIETIKKEVKEWFKNYIPEEDIIFYETTSEMGNLGRQNRDAFYNDTTLTGENVEGKLRVMFAINQYNEGVHAPNIDGVIMGRGTTSDIVYFEQLGRALSVRGNTRQEYEKFEKYDISELIQLCKYRDILIDKNATKEEIIQKLIAPVIIDLTNNFEFIQELENNLKDRIKEIQIQKGENEYNNNFKIMEVSFDIEVLNSDLFKILLELRERLAPISWEEMYALAENYYRKYGNLEIPQKFKTKNGFDYDNLGVSLGFWLAKQREKYKNQKLSSYKIEKLFNIGFVSNPHDEAFDTWYLLAKKYYQHYGNLDIPYRFRTNNGIDYDKDGVKLGNWISNMRKSFLNHKMTDERYNQLLEIGMRFEHKVTIMSWDEWYLLACNFYKKHSNLEIPLSFRTINGADYQVDGVKLGNWIGSQRSNYKHNRLSKEKLQKLLSIGMIFRREEYISTGEEMYELAKKYYEHYGNLEIPSSFKTKNGIDYMENGVNLGGWIQNQREKYNQKKISKDRVEKLLQIGMRFEATYHDDTWNEWYELAKKYYEHYGNLEIPHLFKTKNGVDYDSDGVNLGSWVINQRKAYNLHKLSDERMKKLLQIGMRLEIDKFNVNWEDWYKLAKDYYEHYGNLEIPQKYKTKNGIDYDEEGLNLGAWISTQRQRYVLGKLSEDRISKLELIGIVWKLRKNQQIISEICLKYGVDYKLNKSYLKHTTIQELQAKIEFLNQQGISIINDKGLLIDIFSMSSYNMKVKYGVSLEEIISEYYIKNKISKGV